MNLVTITKEHNLILKNNITEFLTPNYVYLKINENSKFKVTIKDYIHKNTNLYDMVSSPVSGNALGIKKINNQKYLVIKNDFKEKINRKTNTFRNLNKLSKEKFLKLLEEYNKELFNTLNKEYDRLIINDIDSSIYSGNYIYINLNYNKEVLDMIDYLAKILKVKESLILLKETDYTSINVLNNKIGMYPTISFKFLPDKYLISNEVILKNYLNLENNYLYLNIIKIYELYNYIVKKKNKEEKLITITGNAISNPSVILLKYGTSLKEIISSVIKIKEKDYVVFKNNVLYPVKINIDDTIIDDDIDTIFIMKKDDINEQKCINCGKCNEVCPLKINIHKLVNNKRCDISKCIKCGLCSYVCPSRININKLLEDYHE